MSLVVMLRGHLLTAPAKGITPQSLTFTVPIRFLDAVCGFTRPDNDNARFVVQSNERLTGPGLFGWDSGMWNIEVLSSPPPPPNQGEAG